MRRACVLGVAAILFAWGLTVAAAPCAGFNDVDTNDPVMAGACQSIEWMRNRAITFGTSDTTYSPFEHVTRLQMAAFMYRLGYRNAFLRGGNAFGAPAVLGTTDDQPLEVRVNGVRALRIYVDNPSSPNIIGGPFGNVAAPGASGVTIAGGGQTGVCGASRSCSHFAGNDYVTVSGGISNHAAGFASLIAGGDSNTASGTQSAVLGGVVNEALGYASVTVGGFNNRAVGDYSLAAGRRAKATTTGTFMWADSTNVDFVPSVANFFGARATGGVGFTVAVNESGGSTQFCNYLPGFSGWSCTSDRDAKENFVSADTEAILEKLVAMPLSSWNYKGADPTLRMLGPTSQDFDAAFELGAAGNTIASGNLHGVALAAIKGLNARLEAKLSERDARIAALARSNDELRRAVEALTTRVAATLGGQVAAPSQ